MTGKIEKQNTITKIEVIGCKVCVMTERKDEDRYDQWMNEGRF